MLDLVMHIAAALLCAGGAVFLLLAGLDVVLFLKLRSMFDRGVPFAGY